MKYSECDLHELEFSLRYMAVRSARVARKLRGRTKNIPKNRPDGTPEPLTDGDLESHRCFVREFHELPEGFGCVGEEEDLRIECTFEDAEVRITFDAVDGTKVYAADYVFGSTVMIALVVNDQVVAAYIADINSGDVFGYGPSTSEVRRWRDFDVARAGGEPLSTEFPGSLKDQPILLRNEREDYPPRVAAIARSTKHSGGIFSRYVSCDSGVSIGLSMVQLLCGHVGALVMASKRWSPWDDTPLIGLAKAMGMVFLRPISDGTTLEEFEPPLVEEVAPRDYVIFVVHRSSAAALQEGYAAAVL
ncbi:MAG TPA: inositol monophosphatase family protein [Candidatus Saccharimonadales bacterium]|nr:inositol monophosphatase family protein [Candidatus Saccharimonadales bacterium]